MPSRDLNDLIQDLRPLVEQLLQNCRNQGYEMRVYNTLRTPFEQARLWRQSRSWHEISESINDLRNQGADFLSFCLEDVGPQYGRLVTYAIPGVSWHQWGEAVDCFWLIDGYAEWSSRKLVNGRNGFHVYADEAARLGMQPGGHWSRFKDWVHVQFRRQTSPLRLYSLPEINNEMERRFRNV